MPDHDSGLHRPSTRLLRGAFVLLAVTVGYALWLGIEGRPLQNVAMYPDGPVVAPRGGLSLQMPMSAIDASDIVRTWWATPDPLQPQGPGRRSLADRFHRQLLLDFGFIALYWLTFTLFIAWGLGACRQTGCAPRLLLLLPAAAAMCDVVENGLLFRILDGLRQDGSGGEATLVALARLASQLKFGGTLASLCAGIVLVGGGLRGRWRWTAAKTRQAGTFEDLVNLESGTIRAERPWTVDVGEQFRTVESTEEPRVSFRSSDYVGLALSGGGIRSATFNLGLLQELASNGVLETVDYLSTVSGGGYVGGFWSAWLSSQTTARKRQPNALNDPSQALFPVAKPPAPEANKAPEAGKPPEADKATEAGKARKAGKPPEPGEVRHLREFAGFLAPRRGLFEAGMWRAVVAILAGLIPALSIALSMIGLLLMVWLTLTFVYACELRVASVLTATALAGIILIALEVAAPKRAISTSKADQSLESSRVYVYAAAVALSIVAVVQTAIPGIIESVARTPMPVLAASAQRSTDASLRARFVSAPGASAYERWWHLVGLDHGEKQLEREPFFSPRLFDFSLAWLSAAIALLIGRVAHAIRATPWHRSTLSTYDRVVMRLLGMGLGWFVLAAVWHLCVNVTYLGGLAVSALVSAGAFAALRNWFVAISGRSSDRPSAWRAVARQLPQVLAYLTLLLIVAVVGRGLLVLNGVDWMDWYMSGLVMSAVLAIGLLIDPGQFGLHAFYRDRLGRAYLGARATSIAADNRATELQNEDDVPMFRLPARPLHLVCCAANDLRGDPVGTLSRGARSATLSRHGLALGNYFDWTANELELGAAITASAAAFNSNMGGVSIRFGPVVGFLLTALNLRLGLWVRHPQATAAGTRRWPGLLLYREFFSQTSASGSATRSDSTSPIPVMERDVHLSDGGHFENLALYELIRRQCRYVIVSDCGADPTVAFDDLGNALRRVREDFGVEVSIDVEPLRPNEKGWSRQHVAVGRIKYSHVNQGVLVYIKPALTGSEPPDVLQYRTRNHAFPHESTGDQFYDEAQWESYRRLGQHTAERVFHFVKEEGRPKYFGADWLFAKATDAWYPTPADLRDRVLEMTARFGELENELRRERDSALLREVFPELGAARARLRPTEPRQVPPAPSDVSATDLAFMLRATQLLEDVWMACQLDLLWAHPLNMGWVNLFARWTTAPTFQFWWPFLAPMYSPGFQRFLRQRIGVSIFGLPDNDSANAPRPLEVKPLVDEPTGLAMRWWRERSNQRRRWESNPGAFTFYALLLPIPAGARLASREPVQIGLTAVMQIRCNGRSIAGWTSDDFFVPPSLWGAGYGSRMLAGVIEHLTNDKTCAVAYVCVKAPDVGADNTIAREDERVFVAQYRAFGFQQIPGDGWKDDPTQDDPDDPDDSVKTLKADLKTLGFQPGSDTVLLLQFPRPQTPPPMERAQDPEVGAPPGPIPG
jgi:hypothetical protein